MRPCRLFASFLHASVGNREDRVASKSTDWSRLRFPQFMWNSLWIKLWMILRPFGIVEFLFDCMNFYHPSSLVHIFL